MKNFFEKFYYTTYNYFILIFHSMKEKDFKNIHILRRKYYGKNHNF